MNIKQGYIYTADLNPVKGSEQSGKRPVVVISGNTMNSTLPVAIVCPLSSQVKKYYGCVPLAKTKTNGLKSDSEVLTFQIRTISQDRLTKSIGKITHQQLQRVHDGLNKILKF